jgi:hypothetical protein
MDHSVAAMEEILGEIGTLRIFDLFTHLDEKYMRPLVSVPETISYFVGATPRIKISPVTTLLHYNFYFYFLLQVKSFISKIS